MISNIKIQGNFPRLNANLAPALERISDRMFKDVKGEFDSSGYGRWLATREGKPSYLGGSDGKIAQSMTKESTATSATVYIMDTIHQRGGLMIVTNKMRSYFWAMWYETGDDKFKWMALNRRGTMTFPIRTYATFLDTFFEYAKKELLGEIYKVGETTEKINTTPEWSTSR